MEKQDSKKIGLAANYGSQELPSLENKISTKKKEQSVGLESKHKSVKVGKNNHVSQQSLNSQVKETEVEEGFSETAASMQRNQDGRAVSST